MLKWYLDKFNIYYETPGDGGGGGLGDLETLQDDTGDSHEEGDESKDTDDKKDDSGESDGDTKDEDDEAADGKEDEDETVDDENEDEDEDEDKLDPNAPRLSSWTDIKKKYPDFAKDFPDVKTALFRESAFSEIFPTPKDAEIASRDSETLAAVSSDLIDNGDPIELLKYISGKNKDSAHKIAIETLKYFQENDKDFYFDLAALPIKQLLRAAYREGKGKGEEGKDSNIALAAKYLHRFYFDNENVEEALKSEAKAPEKSAKEKELEDRLDQINKREESEFSKGVDASYISKMTAFVRGPLDSDERLTEYMKSKLVDDILKEVKIKMFADKGYAGKLSSLFKQARAASFSNDYKTRIITTALVRAKSLVPEVRKKLVAEALRSGKKKESGSSENNRPPRRESRERERKESTPSRRESRDQPNKPLSDIDILRGK